MNLLAVTDLFGSIKLMHNENKEEAKSNLTKHFCCWEKTPVYHSQISLVVFC
jgi:hypothetical protein